jgi:hypothetical protein
MKRLVWILLGPTLVGALLALSGCGDRDDDDLAPDTPAGVTTR